MIFDLEDAVAPEAKAAAREKLARHLSARPNNGGRNCVIRVNPLASEWGTDDLAAGLRLRTGRDPAAQGEHARATSTMSTTRSTRPTRRRSLKLWTMIETPKAMLNIGAFAEFGRDRAARLDCFVAGTNDLLKETGVLATPDRRYLMPWLMQMVLAARAGGLDMLDGVSNDFRDLDAFARECAEGAAMGFDGKTLIHPAQIEPAKRRFRRPRSGSGRRQRRSSPPSRCRKMRGKGVISLDGKMVERLHLAQAERLLAQGRPRSYKEEIMKLYRFLTGPDDSSFCHKVTAALNKGWHLYGSPTYASMPRPRPCAAARPW